MRVLERRVTEDRRARERERRLAALPIGDALARLIESGEGEPAPSVASLFRFAIGEVGRRPRERNVMFCRPGALFADALAEGLRGRPDAPCDTELVVLGDPLGIGMAEEGVTWLPADAVAGPPFAVQFGDGPSYVLVADERRGARLRALVPLERPLARRVARVPTAARAARAEARLDGGGVLIADGDADRGRKIATACRSLGIEVRVASHGAAALEIALADKPTAMVAQVALPLIDGTRLAEILHNNPHTRAMRMLFIDDGDRDEAAQSALGRVLPGRADPETIARFIEALLARAGTRDRGGRAGARSRRASRGSSRRSRCRSCSSCSTSIARPA